MTSSNSTQKVHRHLLVGILLCKSVYTSPHNLSTTVTNPSVPTSPGIEVNLVKVTRAYDGRSSLRIGQFGGEELWQLRQMRLQGQNVPEESDSLRQHDVHSTAVQLFLLFGQLCLQLLLGRNSAPENQCRIIFSSGKRVLASRQH
ncbi:hypothetical protein Bbelb_242960 [Branchiostoma belcheri]|nr:hypothetical protein Bbelb_242960 [Branchiostoma belcheri]